MKIKILLVVIFFTEFLITTNTKEMRKEDCHMTVKQIMYRIGDIESGHNDKAVGKDGERGRYQIMPSVLSDYCFKFYYYTRDALRMEQLEDPYLCYDVAKWKVLEDYSHFGFDLIKAINSFNMGRKNTVMGKYKPGYLRKFFGKEYVNYWLKRQNITNYDGEYIWIN
jgi:hypothetical protein